MSTRRVLKVAGHRALVQTTHANGTWQEWVTLPPPDVDPPIRPLAQAAPEVPLSLYGDPGANRAAERRREVNALLESHGLRPKPW